jgi:hypothetical protein
MRKSNNLSMLRFSPEFEFNTHFSQSDLQELLRVHNLDWNVVEDLSVPNGWEVHPISSNKLQGNAGAMECQRLLAVLNANCNPIQTPKTGFHIHWNLLDADGVGIMSPMQLTNVFIDWYNFKRVIELILPESRRGDYQDNLGGVSMQFIRDMQTYADRLGKDDKTKTAELIGAYGTTHCRDIRISSSHKTLEFRKAIFTVDDNKLNFWIEFTRNFVKFNMAKRQKNFRHFMDDCSNRLSLSHPKGLAWSFRSVFQYRAGNFGAMKWAEKRALQLARNNTQMVDTIQGITEDCRAKNNS